ncbi:hypothetical protein V1527DRAFT_195576 [Lipomyces starkeyi]
MSRTVFIYISKTSKRSTVIHQRVKIVRPLAFLANPTPLHWAYLTENGLALDTPFSHWCNRGEKRSDGQVAWCINGQYHGRFASYDENVSHKYCGNGARPLCPGHGIPKVNCIFTHPDGTIKPCLNLEDMDEQSSNSRYEAELYIPEFGLSVSGGFIILAQRTTNS